MIMDTEFRRSITTTVIIIIAIAMLFATFSMGVVLTDKSSVAMKKIMNDYMLSVSNTAAGMVDGDELKQLDYGCEETPAYSKIYRTLETFNDNTKLEDIYCIKPDAGKGYIFAIDLTDDDPAKFGDPVMEVTDALVRASMGEASVDEVPYEDEWGRFYSSYSPVFDSEGKLAGVIAVDFDANWYDAQVRSIQSTAFYIGLICIVMGAMIVVTMTANTRRSLRHAHAQLNELSDNVEELMMEVGNLSAADMKKPEKKVKMLYEDDGLDALGEKISNMQTALREQISHIQENAFVDSMTGTKNRNSYLEDVGLADPDIKDGRLSFAVAVFDITGLKEINDELGHECGDRAIIDSARILREVFGRDNLYRTGGDEFVAAVRFATAADMKSSFRRIDSLLQSINTEGGQYDIRPLVLAKGYAVFDPENDDEFMDTFRRADKKMYDDKAEYYRTHDRRKRQ